ncbi:MAG: hypothetical protein ACI4Q3_04775 [Kiritimatiellia bacterium]
MKGLWLLLPLALLAGCFTLHRLDAPSVQMTQAPEGRDVKVAVSGFAAMLTQYVPVYSHGTAYVDSAPACYRHGRRWGWGGGYYQTVTTETLVPQTLPNEAFLRRAKAHLEENGFLLRAADPAFTVDVAFDGPFVSSSEHAVEWAWMLLSVLSAEYSVQTWTAKLKVYDNKTGRVVFHRDYSQRFEDVVWSPLFFVGLAGYEENSFNFMQNWCLTALTDRALADATAFMAR